MRLSAPRRSMGFKITPTLRERASIRLPGSHDFPRRALVGWAPGRSALQLSQAFAPPTLLTAAQGSRAQWITLISNFCSTNSSHSRPRLPGAVDYTYFKLLLHHLFSQPPKAPGRSGLHLYQAFAPPTLLTAAQGSRGSGLHYIKLLPPKAPGRSGLHLFQALLHHLFSQPPKAPGRSGLTLISSFCSTNSSHSRPRLPGAVDYTYIKLLLHQLFSQPLKASGRSVLHLYKDSANPRSRVRLHSAFEVQLHTFAQFIPSHQTPLDQLLHPLQPSRPRKPEPFLALVHIVRFADFNFHPALGPLALEQICPACALEVVLSIREEVVDLALKGGGADGRHLLKSAGSRGNEQGLTEVQNLVDPRVYDVGVGTDDERVLEDSGWWRRCPVFLGSGSTLPKNERIAARRWLIRPRIRPESKLQDKCFERTAALDVENTMCRVNGIGSNAGAWDAADRGGTLSESLGTGLTLPKNELRLQGAEAGLCDSVTPPSSPLPSPSPPPTSTPARISHLPAAARGRERGVSPRDACSADAGACGRYLARRARAGGGEAGGRAPGRLSILWIVRGSNFFSAIRRNAAPTYVPSEEDVLRACAKSTAIIETRFWMGGLSISVLTRSLNSTSDLGRSFPIHLLDVPPAPVFSPSCEGTVYGAPARGLRGTDALRSVRAPVSWGGVVLEDGDVNDGGGEDADAVPPDASLRRANRMRGPLYLFESVINSLWFLRTSVILFLNKIDVFKRNIVSRPSSSPRATTSTSRALGAARAAATAPVTSAVGYSTPFSPPVRPARGRYLLRLGLCLFWPRWGRWGAENASSARWSESYPATYINTFEIQI
ncbi:hypothetical protein B0H14DRAFT_2617775 [Mycena olivaceomarginata]|nr:hypothetical protein B0H14DRAFT_2617775 [Mycena olivaceomarginata]